MVRKARGEKEKRRAAEKKVVEEETKRKQAEKRTEDLEEELDETKARDAKSTIDTLVEQHKQRLSERMQFQSKEDLKEPSSPEYKARMTRARKGKTHPPAYAFNFPDQVMGGDGVDTAVLASSDVVQVEVSPGPSGNSIMQRRQAEAGPSDVPFETRYV